MSLLITLGKQSVDSRVELNGVDITDRIRGVEIIAFVGVPSFVRLTLTDDVVVIGEPGRLEFIKRDKP